MRTRNEDEEHDTRDRRGDTVRLDLTVSVLRRLSTNVVDLFTRDGEYIRVLQTAGGPVVARVKQPRVDSLILRLEGGSPRDRRQTVEIVRRVLGVDRDVTRFDRAARRLPWLRSLAIRMRGVKPPRYPTLWEACVNAILFQQVSKGIGPWTASMILLRGLGRLDLFPMNDSSVLHNLAFVTGSRRLAIDDALETLGPQRGMLYYYLLLARLEARGDLGRASATRAA